MQKLTFTVKVKNALGLHTRPATYIVRLLQQKKSAVQFIVRDQEINARSILGILTLAACQHTTINVIVEGSDAEETADLLKKAFETEFGEVPHGRG